jgi:hypothetical protein
LSLLQVLNRIMSKHISIVAARRGRDSIGGQILATLAAAVFGAALLIAHPGTGSNGEASPFVPPPEIPASPAASSGARHVIAVGQGTRPNRCDVRGFANGVPLTFEVDSGDPNIADFPGSYAGKLSIRQPLDFFDMFPGTRYGKIAKTTLHEIRIGGVIWRAPEVNVFSDWDYSFGSDEVPLLGLRALQMHGINVEFDGGDRCRLTVARNGRGVS